MPEEAYEYPEKTLLAHVREEHNRLQRAFNSGEGFLGISHPLWNFADVVDFFIIREENEEKRSKLLRLFHDMRFADEWEDLIAACSDLYAVIEAPIEGGNFDRELG